MPICPECKTDQPRRKKRACPNCGTEVNIYNGYWYRSGLGSPTVAMLERFEELVSNKIGTPFVIPRNGNGYQRELVAAQRYLDQAGGDYDLIEEALVLMFTRQDLGAWKTRSSLLYIGKDFNLALAIARKNLKERRQAQQTELQSVQRLLLSEDVFRLD